MHWQDQAIILGSKPQGERNSIVELMSLAHGRYFGLVRGGRGRLQQPVLQAGNHVFVEWNARLEEHLGVFRIELLNPYAALLMQDVLALYGFQLAVAHLRFLPEREKHQKLYEILEFILKNQHDIIYLPELLIRFEFMFLQEMGFGLDLNCCAVTGEKDNLIYVSPRTGRAVSKDSGLPWKDKLLKLPSFLLSSKTRITSNKNVQEGFCLTGYFLERYLWGPRNFSAPPIRTRFIERCCNCNFDFSKNDEKSKKKCLFKV